MADGRVVEAENMKKVLHEILKIKNKKEGQFEEKSYRYVFKSWIWTKKKQWLV